MCNQYPSQGQSTTAHELGGLPDVSTFRSMVRPPGSTSKVKGRAMVKPMFLNAQGNVAVAGAADHDVDDGVVDARNRGPLDLAVGVVKVKDAWAWWPSSRLLCVRFSNTTLAKPIVIPPAYLGLYDGSESAEISASAFFRCPGGCCGSDGWIEALCGPCSIVRGAIVAPVLED